MTLNKEKNMIILAQDRKHLVDCKVVSVEKNFGGKKDEKYSIQGQCGEAGLMAFNLGSYPDEKTAVDELEKIYTAFAEGAKTYMIK